MLNKTRTLISAFLFSCVGPLAWAGTVTVTSGTTYQTISGFGAASVWVESKVTAGLATQFWTDDSSQPPANQVNGNVGLSILRIVIDDSGNSNWGTGCNSAKQALAINPNMRIFASPWSPPAKWKNNNQTAGNNTGSDNGNPGGSTNQLITSDYAAYATYLTSFVTACKNTYGFTPYAISVQNEPDYDPSYDACLWSASAFDTFIGTNLGPTLQAAGFNNIVMMPESFADNLNLAATTMGDANAAKYVKVVAAHLYGGGPNTVPASYSTTAGHAVESWETEFSEKTSDGNIDSGLYYSNSLHNCIVDHNFNAWNYWWLINLNTDDEGLCDSSGTPTKRLYCLGNYSKFVRPGYVRIGATEVPSAGVSVSAFYSATAGKVVIVAINNNSSTQNQTFNYSDLSVSTAYPWITDSSRNLVQQTSVAVAGGSFTYPLPAQSVCSFVASVSVGSTPTFTYTPSKTFTPTSSPTSTATKTNTPANTATSTTTTTRTSTSTPTFTVGNTSTTTMTFTRTQTPTNTSSATPTNTLTATRTSTPTLTATTIFTSTTTSTRTMTSTLSPTSTPVNTATPTSTATAVFTSTTTATKTMTATLSSTATPVNTFTPTSTATTAFTPTSTMTRTVTSSTTPTATSSFTSTPVNTATQTSTATAVFTSTTTSTKTMTATLSPTTTSTSVFTGTSTETPQFSYTVTLTPTVTLSMTSTPTHTTVPTATFTLTPTNTSTLTGTFTSTATSSPTRTMSFTPTVTLSPTDTGTPTNTFQFSPTITSTLTTTRTPTDSFTPTVTFTPTWTSTATSTFTPTRTWTPIFTSTDTSTSTPSFTATPSETSTSTPTKSFTPTNTFTSTYTYTPTRTATITYTPTWTFTPTSTTTQAPTPLPGHVGIYPNPVTGPTVNILPPSYSGYSNVRVEIFTINFRKVQDTTFDSVPTGTAVVVSLTGRGGNPLANGLYYVVVTTNSGRAIGKLLILR